MRVAHAPGLADHPLWRRNDGRRRRNDGRRRRRALRSAPWREGGLRGDGNDRGRCDGGGAAAARRLPVAAQREHARARHLVPAHAHHVVEAEDDAEDEDEQQEDEDGHSQSLVAGEGRHDPAEALFVGAARLERRNDNHDIIL